MCIPFEKQNRETATKREFFMPLRQNPHGFHSAGHCRKHAAEGIQDTERILRNCACRGLKTGQAQDIS